MRRKIDTFFLHLILLSTYNGIRPVHWKIERLLWVGYRMFYSSKIHNIEYILLKWILLKTETLKNKFAMASLQTKNIRELS